MSATEYKRAIPIESTIDAVLFTATFANLLNPEQPKPSNLTIVTEVNLTDMLIEMPFEKHHYHGHNR
jgi:hypothetical protein